MKVSRRAIVARGALAGWLTPLLANDAKLPDLKPIVAGATAANWRTAKPEIMSRLASAMNGRLAKDADLKPVLLALDGLDHEGEDMADPDEMEVTDKRRARDAGGQGENIREHGEERLGPDAKRAADRRAKDKAARDKAAAGWAKDEEPETEAEMKARHEREAEDRAHDEEPESEKEMMERHEREGKDAKRARDRRAKDAAAETEAKEKEERKAEDARRASDRHATDEAIRTAIASERVRQEEIREAERVVRPWIGEIALAQDSAEAIYRLALDSLNVNAKGIHPSALRAVLEAQPRPGDRPVGTGRLAMDTAGGDAFAKRFPALAAVRHY